MTEPELRWTEQPGGTRMYRCRCGDDVVESERAAHEQTCRGPWRNPSGLVVAIDPSEVLDDRATEAILDAAAEAAEAAGWPTEDLLTAITITATINLMPPSPAQVEAIEPDRNGARMARLLATGELVTLIGRYGDTAKWRACRDLTVVPHHAQPQDCLDVNPADLTLIGTDEPRCRSCGAVEQAHRVCG